MGPWTPARLRDVTVWLDAANEDTLSLDGNTVVSWQDSYGNNIAMTQPTVTRRPTLLEDSQNQLPGVSFNGITQGLVSDVTIGITGDAAFSAYVIYRKRTATSGTVYGLGSLEQSLGSMILFDNNTLVAYAYAGNNNFRIEPVPTQQTVTQALVKRRGAIDLESQAFRDGTNTATTNHSNKTPNIVQAPLKLGSFDDVAGFFLDGIVYEVLITPVAHGPELRQVVEGYLAHKWGTEDQLPADHPYKQSAP